MPSARRPVSAAAALAASLLLAAAGTACSSGGGAEERSEPREEPQEEPRLDIDPRSFYENYQPGTADSATAGAPSSGGVAPGAPAGPSGPSAPPAPASPSGADRSASGTGGFAADAPDGESAPTDVAPPPSPPEAPTDHGFLDDNTFVDHGSNPFVTVASDPESTFGLDVDTGSYSIGRTFLTEGLRPEPASVRTEEWVNAFGYDYDPPDEGDLAVHLDGAPAPFADDGTRLLRVGVQGREVAREDRPPAALTLVVDTSGSMDLRERLGLVQSTLALLALELRDSDTVSVVTFAEDARVILPPTPAEDAETIVTSIGQLTPSGGTNMEAGLREGYAQARAAFRPGGINTVVLASDGVANQGITGTDPLSDLVRSQGAEGISLVTVGYGMGNYDDDLMEQLADRGDGFYSYVDTYEEAERLFTTELTSTLTVIAEETRAQVTFDPEAVSSYRLVGYENRDLADESFRDDTVDTGEMGAGHTVTALYEVRLAEDGGDELGTVTVRHRPAGEEEFEEQTEPIARDDMAPSLDEASDSLRLAGAVATFADLLAEHPVVAERDVTLDDVAALVADLAGPAGGSDSDDEAESAEGIAVGEPSPGGDLPPVDEPALDESGRPGAAELSHLIDLARAAAGPAPTPEPDPVPTPRPTPVPTVPPGPG
jgi:Ca-activated chloride channel homolog